jgi:hypothetical protein
MARAKDQGGEKKPTRPRKKKTAEPESRGLTAAQVAAGSPPAPVERVGQADLVLANLENQHLTEILSALGETEGN